MNTFFRICVMICLLMLVFSLVANFVAGFDIFPDVGDVGPANINTTSDALGTLTGLSDPNMNALFIGVTGLTFIGAVVLASLTKTITPIGLHIFGLVFWTSWLRMTSIFSYGGYIPQDFILVFTVGVIFVFIAAIIGMLTGSG